MKTYPKILITTLPLVIFIIFLTVGTTYYFSRTAISNLAETWLETRLAEAMQKAVEQEIILHKYGLENIPASIAKAKLDAGSAMASIEVGKQGFIFVVDIRGIIAMHPNKALIGKDMGKEAWFRKMQPGKGRLVYTIKDQRSLVMYNYFPQWEWFILAADPETEVYGVVNQMKPYVLYMGILGAMVMALALMLLTRRLLEPLHSLITGADRIGKGELETRIKIRSRDEFGHLAKVFNQMASQLQESHQELEQRVAERTDELIQTNKRLHLEIKERKQAVDALIANEQRVKGILRASPVGIGLAIDRKLNWANEAMYRMVGYEKEAMVGRAAGFLYRNQNEFRRVGRELYDNLSDLEIGQVETQWIRKDGTIIDCIIRSYSLDPQDSSKGIIFAVADISEAKRLEAKLQRSKKMEAIGTLAGGVAHDLNNILSGIVSYPELLLLKLPDDSPLRKPILTIQKSGERAATIVQDLLTMARRGVAVTEVLNINHIISEQFKSPEFKNLEAFHPDVQFALHLEEDLLNIKGSSAHLSKSIMNLISNAAEAMPEGGKTIISTKSIYIERPIKGYEHVEEGDYVSVLVSDTGVGMSDTDMERIFEPFYTKKEMGRSGTGLGMAVVWGTVKDHNGYIDIQSSEGKGSTFTLYFPVTREGLAEDKSLLPIEKYQGKGETILIVDDSEVQREIAKSILEQLGYSIATASSGEDAVEYLKHHSADLLVLDMIMSPGMDGLDTYRQIIELNPVQKVIIASGFSETRRVKKAQTLGAGRYIKKPYTIEKIGIAVREELEK